MQDNKRSRTLYCDIRNKNMTVERFQLTLRANRLKNVAGAFKGTSDPYAVVTMFNPGDEPVELELDRTEVIKNSLCPAWTTAIPLECDTEKATIIRVKVFDEVTKSADIAMGGKCGQFLSS